MKAEYTSRFSITERVMYKGERVTVEAVRFTESKVWYDVRDRKNKLHRDIDSREVTPAVTLKYSKN